MLQAVERVRASGVSGEQLRGGKFIQRSQVSPRGTGATAEGAEN